MINFKKGPALSLGQVDKVAKPATTTIEAGHVVRIGNNGSVVEATLGASATPNDDLLGFAIHNATNGDVIESGKLGVYLLDGATVLETDKTELAINATNYPIGTPLKADGVTGNVKSGVPGTDRIIGYVERIRNLPSIETVGSTKIQSTRPLLGIKLSV